MEISILTGVRFRGLIREVILRPFVLMEEVLDYAADLASMTGGQGMFVMEYDHDVPEHLTR